MWGVRAGQWGRAEPPGPYIFLTALYQKSLESPPHKYHQHTQTLSMGPEKHPQRDTLTPHPHPSAPHGFLGLTAKLTGVSRRWLPAGDPAHRVSPGSGPRRAEGTPARLWGTTPRSQSPRGEPGGRMHRFPRCCHPVKGHPFGFGFGFGASTGTPRRPQRGGSRHRPPRASCGCCGVPGGLGGPTPSSPPCRVLHRLGRSVPGMPRGPDARRAQPGRAPRAAGRGTCSVLGEGWLWGREWERVQVGGGVWEWVRGCGQVWVWVG